MILSQTAQYALRAVIYLAAHRGEGPRRVDDIARELAIPRNYLSKVLHALTRGGVLDSTRGPNGGFELSQPAEELLLVDVLEPFGAVPDGRLCLLGPGICSEREPCRAHARWQSAAAAVRDFFDRTTVAEIAASPAHTSARDQARG